MPRTPAEADPEDQGMSGFPKDGDPHEPAGGDPPEPEGQEPPTPPDPIAEIRAEVATLKRQNEELRRNIPPIQPKSAATPEEDPEPDWDKLLFADPKQALKLHGERVAKQVSTSLRAEYQKDRGTTEFWNRFYAANPELRQDSDLVEIVLNSNLPNLANIPVEDAYTRLAELTRERILRYAGGAAKERRPKARAEGAGGSRPSPPSAPPAPDTTVTRLSDVLRTRRQSRRKAGAA